MKIVSSVVSGLVSFLRSVWRVIRRHIGKGDQTTASSHGRDLPDPVTGSLSLRESLLQAIRSDSPEHRDLFFEKLIDSIFDKAFSAAFDNHDDAEILLTDTIEQLRQVNLADLKNLPDDDSIADFFLTELIGLIDNQKL